MSPYTIVNLKQVENLAPKFGLGHGLESRFAREPLALRASGVSYFRYAPGYRISFGHRHRDQEEIYVVVSGTARTKVGDDIVELGPWDALRVSPDTARQFEAGPEGTELIAFGAPSNGNRDVEMLPGWWAD
jgi:mannose-6-phosphate isomerase-like protein (cupin superfamily)